MKVEAITFANRAAIEDGLLQIEGAGWEYVRPPLFPATISGYVAGVLALDKSEHHELTEVRLKVRDDDGQIARFRASIVADGARPKAAAGVPFRVPFAIPFTIVARGPTVMKASLESDRKKLAVIACSIDDSTPDSLPQGFGSA